MKVETVSFLKLSLKNYEKKKKISYITYHYVK